MKPRLTQHEKALKAAQMYYFQNLPMKHIAAELEVSHSTISRLLNWARHQGLVEIRINDIRGRSSPLEELIKLHYEIKSVKVVPVPATAGEEVLLDRVAMVAAGYLNQLMTPDTILGIAWGQTVSRVADNLLPRPLDNAHVVQLNGGDFISNLGVQYAGELVTRLAQNYEATAHLFPVPAFFDFPETKIALWRETSIQRILELHRRADVLLFSIGAYSKENPGAHLRGEHLNEDDYRSLERCQIVGDIANIVFRADGSFIDIELNRRACGPDLALFQKADRALCVVSGSHKLPGLKGALAGGYLTDLIIDGPTAKKLVDSFTAKTSPARRKTR